MKSIKVISNPNSGHNRKNPRHLQTLSKILQNELYLPTLDQLSNTIQRFQEERLEILGISGGDGTIHQVLTTLNEVYQDNPWPKIVLLPSGTMNNIAKNTGFKKRSTVILRKVMDKIRTNQPFQIIKKRPLIVGNRVGFIFGFGGIAQFLDAYYEGGNPSQLKAATLLTRAIGSAFINGSFVKKVFRPTAVDIRVDGRSYIQHKRFTVAGISTLADLGFGFRPFYRTLTNHEVAQFIGFTQPPIWIALALPKIRLASAIQSERVADECGATFTLKPESPMKYTIDGDLYTVSDTLDLTLGPMLEFIQ
ncbi:MAG: diacylglycerol kinase family protein [Myxococcota bacterium]|nr:diacylglycerol kinase family protein [Myxococcota bacterium]